MSLDHHYLIVEYRKQFPRIHNALFYSSQMRNALKLNVSDLNSRNTDSCDEKTVFSFQNKVWLFSLCFEFEFSCRSKNDGWEFHLLTKKMLITVLVFILTKLLTLQMIL